MLLTAVALSTARGQAYTVQVRDTVRIPSLLPVNPTDMTGIIFDEIWSVYPSRPSLYKEVTGYTAPESGKVTEKWPSGRYRESVTYEYELLDPQTGKESPASVALRELVRKHSAAARNYDLGTQLISVRFREEWNYDTVRREFLKEVQDVTPVIWQRRQTKEGQPVNDGETGLPVYYRLELEPILLRNP